MSREFYTTVIVILALGAITLLGINYGPGIVETTRNYYQEKQYAKEYAAREAEQRALAQAANRREKEACEKERNLPTPQGPWKTFEIRELGLSFQYPPKYQDVSYEVYLGETGKMIRGFLSSDINPRTCPLPPRIDITFAGLTPNYTASRGGNIYENLGYEKRSNTYALKYPWGKSYAIPYQVKEVKAKNISGIVITGTGPIDERGLTSTERMAIFNLPSPEFPAVSFIADITQVSEKEFEEIVRTVEIK